MANLPTVYKNYRNLSTTMLKKRKTNFEIIILSPTGTITKIDRKVYDLFQLLKTSLLISLSVNCLSKVFSTIIFLQFQKKNIFLNFLRTNLMLLSMTKQT